MGSEEETPGLLSIERVVAFVLGPAVTAGSGWLSAWLANKLGVQVNSDAIVAAFAAGGLGAAGLAYKWLHGRQVEMGIEGNKTLEEIRNSPVEGLITTTLQDLEGLAQSAATKAVSSITHTTAGQGAAEPPQG